MFTLRDNHKAINVDLHDPVGVARAERLGFVGDKLSMADVMFAGPLANILGQLFTKTHKAALFTVFRHPVDRAVSTFYYLQKAHWENSYAPEWANMTLLEYVHNYRAIEENWLVRWLSGKPQLFGDPLDYEDLEKAKLVLRDYMWIGLTDHMEESMERFGQLFGWNRMPQDTNNLWQSCVQKLGREGSNVNKHKAVNEGEPEYAALAELNKWDMMLYEYAVELFHQDGKDHFRQLSQSTEEVSIEDATDHV